MNLLRGKRVVSPASRFAYIQSPRVMLICLHTTSIFQCGKPRNVGSCVFCGPLDRYIGRHIDRHIGRVSVDILTDDRPICRLTCRLTLGRYIDRDVSVDILTDISTEISADMSTDMSVDMLTESCCPTVGRRVDR